VGRGRKRHSWTLQSRIAGPKRGCAVRHPLTIDCGSTRTSTKRINTGASAQHSAGPSFWTQSVGRWLVSDTLSFLQRLASKSASSSLTPFEQKQQSCAETAWWTLSGQRHLAAHANVALENALTHCAENGWNRVAIFGAGRHTRAAGHALLNPPVEIVAVLDDNQLLSGTRMWGYHILSSNAAHSLSIDAVVISSDTHETTLAHAARSAFPASVHIVTPYSLPGAPHIDTRTTNMTSSTTGTAHSSSPRIDSARRHVRRQGLLQ
jgi:hypothetical protein